MPSSQSNVHFEWLRKSGLFQKYFITILIFIKNIVKTKQQTNLNAAFVEALGYLHLTVTIKHLFSTCGSKAKQISRN
jgi:hypothetical protein